MAYVSSLQLPPRSLVCQNAAKKAITYPWLNLVLEMEQSIGVGKAIVLGGTIGRAHSRMGTRLAYATIFVDVGIQVRAPIRCSMSLEGSFNINICSFLFILNK